MDGSIYDGDAMADYIQITTTVEQKKDAETIARMLLEARLVACVQIVGPITSHYWWNDAIDQAEEYLCLIKSREDLYVEVEAAIIKKHPYEVPEIIATPIIAGSKEYTAWLAEELKSLDQQAGDRD
jgi:periplasmic divalent cation tolerance protein